MSSFLNALAWALIHFLWQGALVGLATWLALRFLRRAKPQVRYALACSALLLCLVLPMIGLIRGLASAPAPVMRATPIRMIQVKSPSPNLPMEQDSPAMPDLMTRAESALRPHLALVVLCWALGSFLLAMRLAWGLAWVQVLGNRHAAEADEAWKARLHQVAALMGLNRLVRLRISGMILSPMTVGWWRPIILVPASLLAGMPPELMEALLAHELAHIRRYDYLMNLLQSAIEVLLFYHPAVWVISRRIRIEREQIADDLAARTLGEPRRLALALQELDLRQLHLPNLAQAAHGGHLMARIRHLIQPYPRPLAWKTVVSLVGIASVCVVSATVTARAMGTKLEARNTAEPPPPPPPASLKNVPEPPAPPEPPSPPDPPAAAVELSGPSCAFVRRGGKMIHFTGNSADLKEVNALQKKAKTDLFWFRQGGQTYIIDDPAYVGRIAKFRKHLEELERMQQELGRQMGVHGQRMGDLGAQIGVQTAQMVTGKVIGELNKELLPLTTQMGAYGAQIGSLSAQLASQNLSDAERDALEKQIDEIEKKMDLLEEKIDAASDRMEAKGEEMEKQSKPIEDLGKQMEEAAKPMEALGKQMEELGKLQEKLSPDILKAIQDLIPEALDKGKARPVDITR
jgi:beta-lactamase regulating signal transducer with metallopeptidase domain